MSTSRSSAIFLSAAIAMAGSLVFFPAPAGAADEPCRVQSQLSILKDSRTSRDTNEGVKSELKLRQDLLAAVIDCSLKETNDLKQNLAGLQVGDREMQRVQKELSDRLDDLSRSYENKKTQIADLGLRGTQDMARQLKLQRNGIYAKLAQQILNFTFWSKNQELIRAAQTRLDQIQTTLATLKLESNKDINERLQSAGKSLEEAAEANRQAREALRLLESEDPSLKIKTSLDKLAETYQAFADLSEMVGKLLSSNP